MNLLKKFVRNDNAALEDEYYDDEPVMPEDLRMDPPESTPEDAVSAIDSAARKEPEFRPASTDKVVLKFLKPKSQSEATMIADVLKDGCIVCLDIGSLTKEQAVRLVDFVAGVAYVIGGEMIKTNKTTIVVTPSGVDISDFAQDDAGEEVPAEEAPAEEEYEEVYEETEAEEV